MSAPTSETIWIDTHAHLDDPVFDADRAATLATARAAGVARFINIGYRPARWATTLALAETAPDVAFALGLHPGHADEWTPALLDDLADLAATRDPVAIGEIGLDFFRDGPPADLQAAALLGQLRLARQIGKPAIIHQRAAEPALIAALESEPELPLLVLHSFDGSARYAAFARERGALVGVGGLATRRASARLREVLATIPPDRIVLETDSPYLIPAGVRGRRNTPAAIPHIANHLAGLWGLTPDELATITTSNACRAFGLRATAGEPLGRAR
ncbi:MAG: TatD family hydrolase [Thermomicrobiales bacterium]|nr:TatD family hydrolase [Thermomicrobiales bacterium]